MVDRKQRLVRPFVGRRIAVKAVGAEVLPQVRREHAGPFANRRPGAHAGSDEAALDHESGGPIDRRRDHFAHGIALDPGLAACGHQPEAAGFDNRGGGLNAFARDDVDRPAKRIRAKDRRPGTMEDFDPLDRVERHGDVAIMVTRLRIVQSHAVNEHEHLAEVGAADREVGLDAALTAGPHVDGRGQAQHVRNAADRQPLNLIARNHRQRPRHCAEFDRRRGGRDHHVLPERALGRGRVRECEHEGRCTGEGDTRAHSMVLVSVS